MGSDRAKHLDRLAIEVATLMHGLDMIGCEEVFTKAATLVKLSARFDATGADFRHQVDGFERHYGEPAAGTSRARQ